MVDFVDKPALARALSLRRRRYRHRCAHCGYAIAGIRVRKYCSNACRQAAYRARQIA